MKEQTKKKNFISCLLSYAKESKFKMILSVILSVISIISGLVPFYCFYRVIDLFVEDQVSVQGILLWSVSALAHMIPEGSGHIVLPVVSMIALAGAACYMGYTGVMELSVMLMFVFFSFGIFASLEPISDSAHVLAVINAAMDQLDALKEGNFIDSDGENVSISHYDIEFSHLQSDRTFL